MFSHDFLCLCAFNRSPINPSATPCQMVAGLRSACICLNRAVAKKKFGDHWFSESIQLWHFLPYIFIIRLKKTKKLNKNDPPNPGSQSTKALKTQSMPVSTLSGSSRDGVANDAKDDRNPGSPGVVRDQRGVGGSGRAAAHRVVDDAHRAEARFLPAEPDRRGAVGCGLNTARW